MFYKSYLLDFRNSFSFLCRLCPTCWKVNSIFILTEFAVECFPQFCLLTFKYLNDHLKNNFGAFESICDYQIFSAVLFILIPLTQIHPNGVCETESVLSFMENYFNALSFCDCNVTHSSESSEWVSILNFTYLFILCFCVLSFSKALLINIKSIAVLFNS